MKKDDKKRKQNRLKRFQRGVAIVMILFTVLPMGFSVYQSVSNAKESERIASEQAQLMEELAESPQEDSLTLQDNEQMVETEEKE